MAEKVEEFEVPVIRHPPVPELVKIIVLEAGSGASQDRVIGPGGVIIGKVAGFTVIVLETGARTLPQASVAVQVSVTVPPQASGIAENVDKLELPLIRQVPDNPLS
jgi:hypothetical protein